jgi:hypothetical protein
VAADSPIQTVAALNGKTVVFPAPNAFAASLLIRAHLAGQGIRIEPKYVQTHGSVYRAVALGDASAGGGGSIHASSGIDISCVNVASESHSTTKGCAQWRYHHDVADTTRVKCYIAINCWNFNTAGTIKNLVSIDITSQHCIASHSEIAHNVYIGTL